MSKISCLGLLVVELSFLPILMYNYNLENK